MGAAPWRSVLRWSALRDRVRSSLFVTPLLFVVGGLALAELMLAVDGRLDGVPQRLTATVDSARAVLTVVASATLAFAGIAFSVSLLLVSAASGQYSPRVVHGLFRDPANRRAMGVVMGTFTYSLVVLQAVRGPVGSGGEAVVPSASTMVALVLGVVAILSTVAFISHSAHALDVSEVLHRVTLEALSAVRAQVGALDPLAAAAASVPEVDDDEGHAVDFVRHGWVQQLDHARLLAALPRGALLVVTTAPGRYAVPGTPIGRVLPEPDDPEAVADAVRDAVVLGPTRTLLQDPTYGVRQLADVALRALSPGVNDPTTAQDALFHQAAVLRELLERPAPPRVLEDGDRSLVLSHAPTHREVVDLAFDEVRLAATGQPTVLVYLLEILETLHDALPEGSEEARAALRLQAGLVLATGERGELPEPDRERVRIAYRDRFAESSTSASPSPSASAAGSSASSRDLDPV